ncbi:tRNA (guanosine(46)-N7)-methyltransferase TrmB [Candidatus Parcubacteria bacterium]|nr:MAG: tRNA (guanosine(46)-N7)-methyltransferase TrmB [Candidatus Parcubacteria bacterium]
MPRKKLQRFAQLNTLANVAQIDQADSKEKLATFLQNKRLTLELGCGRGEYTLFLASLNPDQQFIGIDIQGERLWFGAKEAQEKKLTNVLFLRIQIEHLADYFPKNSVDEIWITFPDPYPRDKQIKKRLTSPRFLNLYKKIIKPEAVLNLKTDDKDFFLYSQESIKSFGGQILELSEDTKHLKDNYPYTNILTYYEKIHLKARKSIQYLKFQLT